MWTVCGRTNLFIGFFLKKKQKSSKKNVAQNRETIAQNREFVRFVFSLIILEISEFLMRKIVTLYFSRFQISEFPHPPFMLPTLSSHLDPFGIKSCLIFMGHSEKLQPTRRMNGKGPHRPSALRKGTSSSSKESAVEVVKPNLKKKEDRTEKEKEKKAKSQQEEKKREDAKKAKENEKKAAKKEEEKKREDAKKEKKAKENEEKKREDAKKAKENEKKAAMKEEEKKREDKRRCKEGEEGEGERREEKRRC